MPVTRSKAARALGWCWRPGQQERRLLQQEQRPGLPAEAVCWAWEATGRRGCGRQRAGHCAWHQQESLWTPTLGWQLSQQRWQLRRLLLCESGRHGCCGLPVGGDGCYQSPHGCDGLVASERQKKPRDDRALQRDLQRQRLRSPLATMKEASTGRRGERVRRCSARDERSMTPNSRAQEVAAGERPK